MDTSKPNLIERRKEWNKSAPSEYALPTEIWREVVDRRKRYTEIRDKIDKGEITHINDFITYNLNIRQFTQDVIDNHSDPVFIRHFFNALSAITILDPTCGSGAFLFAAMNILEPLYESCIMRMRSFVEDEDFINNQNKQSFCHKYNDFRETLKYIQGSNHPNQTYFIYKSIILKNLYGVDIMKEAVEIAKLRLFLKMVATVDVDYNKPNLGLEPLPDIDFNIRAGNTLVGFASLNEVIQAVKDKDNDGQIGLVFEDELDIVNAIKNKADDLARVFKSFKKAQLQENIADRKNAKDRLLEYQSDLNDILNEYLAFTYHIDKIEQKDKYKQFLLSHQPFHWFAEFYEIINDNGGFNVVIGNPPYVEYSKVRDTYTLSGFETEKCYNLYGYVIEKSYKILNVKGLVGMIIPISAFSNSSMESLQKYFRKFKLTYLSNYHQRPAVLFEGVLQRLSIFISYKENTKTGVYSTIVFRWKSETRNLLFQSLFYVKGEQDKQYNSLKIGFQIEPSIFKKYFSHNTISILTHSSTVRNNAIYYRTAGGGYWITILNSPFKTNSLSNKSTSFQEKYKAKVISAILNSNLFWWYYSINFDQFNFKDYMIFGFRFNYPTNQKIITELARLSDKIESELLQNATTYVINSKTRGSNETITYNKYYSKDTMDEIDTILAEYYGFTEEELDFIINYDIKYRMGKELENGEEEE